MPSEPLVERVRRFLGSFVTDRGYSVTAGDDQTNSFGAWVRLASDEFVACVIRDRGQEWITVGTKVRPKPRAPLRWWPLGHLVAYLDGAVDPYPLSSLEIEAEWLTRRSGEILDSTLINSEELNQWAAKASRRHFGQTPRK
jgi:hypothetical protein